MDASRSTSEYWSSSDWTQTQWDVGVDIDRRHETLISLVTLTFIDTPVTASSQHQFNGCTDAFCTLNTGLGAWPVSAPATVPNVVLQTTNRHVMPFDTITAVPLHWKGWWCNVLVAGSLPERGRVGDIPKLLPEYKLAAFIMRGYVTNTRHGIQNTTNSRNLLVEYIVQPCPADINNFMHVDPQKCFS